MVEFISQPLYKNRNLRPINQMKDDEIMCTKKKNTHKTQSLFSASQILIMKASLKSGNMPSVTPLKKTEFLSHSRY